MSISSNSKSANSPFASGKNRLNELESECKICMVQWNDKKRPMIIKCFHVFCEDCLVEVRQKLSNNGKVIFVDIDLFI